MELDRRVQIRVNRLEGRERKKGFGSGYLVAPRLVLTAAHVLDHMDPDTDNSVTVTLPDTSEQKFPAVVRWQRTDDTVDAALIEITEGTGWQVPQSLGDLLTRPPQRYGLIIGTRPHQVTASGFPRMQKDTTDGRRLDEQFTGRIAPGTGSLAGRYELTSTDPTPAAAANISGGGSRWSGMSGAAVLTDDGYGGDLLCGVMRRDRQADGGGTRLTATPAARLLDDEAFRTFIAEHTGWEPVLEPVEPAALLTPAAVDRNLRSPAALLRADAEAVAFHGRASELADLRAWCENGPPAIQLRVLTGPGGQGKTRLARRLTDTLGWRGWVAGHLSSDLSDDPALDAAPPDFTTLATSLPLLLVVDYAETRPRLLRRLITHLHRSRHRVRVLLLARSDGEWRTGSLQAVPAVRDILEEAPVIPLAPLIPTSRPSMDRHDAFRRAAHDLARLLPLLSTLPAHDWTSLTSLLRPPADLHDYRYDNVLTLQMAALIALLQHGPWPVDTAPGTPPERTLLKHEDRFWEASAKAPAYKLDLPAPTLAAAVAVAALCGAGNRDEALHVITTLPGLPTHQAGPTAAWLASLYPAEGDRYWGSLQPDRIAEYHASHTLTKGDITLPALLGEAAPGQQAQLITVLARAVIAHYNVGRATDSEHVLRTMDTALDTASLDYRAVQTATAALPYPSRITSPLALRLTALLAHADQQLAAESQAHEPALARSLSNLAIRLAEMGRRGEALTTSLEAVEIYRRLTASNQAAHEPALARSLSNLGADLAEAGQRSEALVVAEQAVEIYRRLAADNQAAYEPALARSLSNLGADLAEAGQRSEALAVAEQAVEIYRRLAADNQAAHEASLAASLASLGVRLAEAGRRGEALTTSVEAVEVYRRLAASNQAAHEPELARSLTSLGNRLAQAGQRSEALVVAEQAVEIYRRLAADNQAAHEPALASSLSSLGNRLAQVGRREEALTTSVEAVEIYRRLAASNQAAHEPELAASLSNLGADLAQVGRQEEALTTSVEAVDIYRRLAASNQAAHEPELAATLTNLDNQLAQAGQRSEALVVAEQAVEIYRRLAADNQAAHEPALASSLSSLGNRLAQVGRREEALTTSVEAVEIYRRLAASNQAAHEPELASSLSSLGNRLAQVGRQEEALTTSVEAVDIYRRLAASNRAAHEPELARSLTSLGIDLAQVGRRGEALVVAEQAVEIYRRLAADNPAAYEPALAASLTNLAIPLSQAGDLSGALRATGEAVELYRSHVATMSSVLPQLHAVLGLQADLLERLGREEEAATVRYWLRENPLPPFS
ncbi:tetratricopeptide repeat protein [Streptomyces sp. NBC_00006]|uniref:tetratricopeptide repeat protein n=1 Tax=Streptomyces sp. NBC_00006 TaxID=2975619 RepID=UPI00225BE547|nr:tetratricopeptide repeat protein [Streptomyces sp. NBC_00006]MCX5529799.1 tetratricopeptide repeat protein [Streptomyces sp. NBC_00006]